MQQVPFVPPERVPGAGRSGVGELGGPAPVLQLRVAVLGHYLALDLHQRVAEPLERRERPSVRGPPRGVALAQVHLVGGVLR